MTEAPERIWMDPDIKFPECEKQYGCDVEYIRKDVSDALVATAREDALREALDAAREYRYRRGEAVENAILALIDKDNSRKAKKPNLVGTGVQMGILNKNPGS
jgi:hypothetical protein